MPITTTDDAPSRPGNVLTPLPVTDRAWRPRRVSTIHRPSSTARPRRNGHGSKSQPAMPATTTRNRTLPPRNDSRSFLTGTPPNPRPPPPRQPTPPPPPPPPHRPPPPRASPRPHP